MTDKFNENLKKLRLDAGVEPALNDGVMLSNAKLCQVSFQNG